MTQARPRQDDPSAADAPALARPRFPVPVRYPNSYTWLVFVCAMDIMLTWVILFFSGSEVNPIAAWVIVKYDRWGAIVFKFSLMLFVIVTCEIVGAKRDLIGQWLARVAVVISGFPVVYSLYLLTYYFMFVWESSPET